tara:strand:- start:1742 stop:2188 length:447 start_codon:yes stop_codon:yes gene_type:complete
MALNWPKMGPNYVPAYQISGLPFVTSSAAGELTNTGNVVKITFPFVTSNIAVTSVGADQGILRVGFTENGVNGIETHSYITLPVIANKPVTSPQLKIRCKELFLRNDLGGGSGDAIGFSVFGQLTTIQGSEFPILTGSSGVFDWVGIG